MPDCYLWMCSPTAPQPADPAAWGEVAECLDAVADAVGLAQAVFSGGDEDDDLLRPAVELLAEGQSMLRVVVLHILGRDDSDQYKIYRWLSRTTSEHQIFLGRHMRSDDPADPAGLPQFRSRLQDLQSQWSERDQRRRRRRAAFQRIRYHFNQLDGKPLDPAHDWNRIARAVHDLVEQGVPPSDVRLRDLLLPRLDDLPDPEVMPPGMQQVLREIDRYLASRPDGKADAPTPATAPEVTKARRLLEGKVVALIGGERRPDSQQNLEQAFGLSELRWLSTSPHQPHDDLEAAVRHPEVHLVLLAIRWTSHSFGQLKETCDRHGKPLVRLPAGYGVNRVASEILGQCSEQLGTDAAV